MATAVQVQFRRGTATELASFTPAAGELVLDATNNRAVVGDGVTVGGWPLAKLSEVLPVGGGTVTGSVTVSLNAHSLGSAQTGTVVRGANVDGTATRFEADAFGASAYFSAVIAGGTNAAPTALGSGIEIGGFNAWGYNGSAYVGPRAAFRTYTAQAWTTGANGTYCDVLTTPLGSTTAAAGTRFQPSGGVTIGSTTTDPGANNLLVTGSINKVTITGPATSATLTIADGKTFTVNGTLTLAGTDGKTLTVNNSLTLAGTDGTTITFPAAMTVAGLGIAQTFTAAQTWPSSSLVGVGGSTGTTKLSGMAASLAANTGNGADTTEDTLASYSLPASAFTTNGQVVRVTAIGTCALNANNKVFSLYFGSEKITSGTITQNGGAWRAELFVRRVTTNSQNVFGFAQAATTLITPVDVSGSETESAAITIKCTGQSPTTGAANDVICRHFTVEFLNF